MADVEQLAAPMKGMKVWDVWRVEHPSPEPDLPEANLAGANQKSAHLCAADLREADFHLIFPIGHFSWFTKQDG